MSTKTNTVEPELKQVVEAKYNPLTGTVEATAIYSLKAATYIQTLMGNDINLGQFDLTSEVKSNCGIVTELELLSQLVDEVKVKLSIVPK